MSDANLRKRKGTRTFFTAKKRRHLDRLNDTDNKQYVDLSLNLDTTDGISNLDFCPLCRGTHSILQPCNCKNQMTLSTTKISSNDNSLQFSHEISSAPSFNLTC